ncbi:FAD/NAD(P)-binding domain-containing protein [Wallemia mellicola]|uniref:FAD/NAD(P)-binding domain-containing protein n=1 Tax=Wallemia mellicola TaxID=1708541 RepID=A0A4T0MCB2_9BASI|nr:FAD/NAD(P)-binding domain-containing protein [Wallemia mellicola]
MTQSPRIAIIGAGLGGLTSAHEILKRMPKARVTLYEVRNSLGGIWNYEDNPRQQDIKFDKYGTPHAAISFNNMDKSTNTLSAIEEVPPSPVYPTLRTNLPVDLMSFRNDSWDDIPDATFPSHNKVLEYIVEYARRHHLEELVAYRQRVTRVRHRPGAAKGSKGCMPPLDSRWEITVDDLDNGSSQTHRADMIVNAAGHYANPYIPFTEGLWSFEGTIFHSRWWRGPLSFRGKKVIVVGSRSSGYDVARELAWLNHAPQNVQSPYEPAENGREPYTTVLQSSRMGPPAWDDAPEWFKSIRQLPAIARVGTDWVEFTDGAVETSVDAIIFATGYNYMFPFMQSDDAPWSSHPVLDDRPEAREITDVIPSVKRLKEDLPECARGYAGVKNISIHQLFYLHDPSFVFIGLQKNIRPFSLWEAQAHVVAHCFALPSSEALPSRLLEPFHRDSNSDIRKAQVWPFPLEFDMTDDMIAAIEEKQTTRMISTLNAINKDKKSDPFHRNHMPPNTKSSFNDRKARDDRLKEMKAREKEMKSETETSKKEHTAKILERRKIKEEKERLAAVKSKADERRRKKQKKREGRSGKVNQ